MLRDWWVNHQIGILRLAIVLMTLAALHRLENEFSRLLWETGQTGAIDLIRRHEEVYQWFAGMPIYSMSARAVYPPASYAILWPFLGWLAVAPARWLWAATTIMALGWCAALIVRESGATTSLERVFIALLLFSMYATSATIGNGQLIVHLLPALIAGLTLLGRKQRRWHEELLAVAFIVGALVSPTIAAPFFWIALFVPDTPRPAVLIALGYAALTLFALSFQGDNPESLLQEWDSRAVKGAAWGAVTGGYANLHSWLSALGLREWHRPASLAVLMTLGLWTYRHRHADLWLLLGVTALVARFWAYHRLYNDLLILLPMITLFRIAKQGPSTDGSDLRAVVLLAMTWVAVLAPARLLASPPPWSTLFAAGQTIVWVLVLIFLLDRASHEKSARVSL